MFRTSLAYFNLCLIVNGLGIWVCLTFASTEHQ